MHCFAFYDPIKSCWIKSSPVIFFSLNTQFYWRKCYITEVKITLNHWKFSIMNIMWYKTQKASKQMNARSSKYLEHSCPHIPLTPTNTHTHNSQQKYTQVPPSTFLPLPLSLDAFHLCSETVSERAAFPVTVMLSAVDLCLTKPVLSPALTDADSVTYAVTGVLIQVCTRVCNINW